ncbi:MAG: hypothetical protein Q7S57_01600 [bacterium]|nr:hypothetical protein [bacterium]
MKLFLKNRISAGISKLANYSASRRTRRCGGQLSKRNVASLFENFGIDNYLKIGNWKLKIWGLLKNTLPSGVKLTCENSLI